jgi:CheY-like chemotaxis protein
MHAVDDVHPQHAMTIVLAEDDSDMRAIYARSLREAGHLVWEASDGGEALALVRAHGPDLLLLDIWMPVFNGIQVLERLAGTPEGVRLKIVVISHQNDSDTRLEGFALGVTDYWTKDLSAKELRDRIARMTGSTATEAGQTG